MIDGNQLVGQGLGDSTMPSLELTELDTTTRSPLIEQAKARAEAARESYSPAEEEAPESKPGFVSNLARTTAAGIVQTSGKTLDMLTDVSAKGIAGLYGVDNIGEILPEDGILYSKSDFVGNDWKGLDAYTEGDFYQQALGVDDTKVKEATKEIGDAYDTGDATEVAMAIVTNMDSAPELIAQSVGEMMMYAKSIGINTLHIASLTNQNAEKLKANQGGKELSAQQYAQVSSAAFMEHFVGKMSFRGLTDKTSSVNKAIQKLTGLDKETGGGIVKAVGRRIAAVGMGAAHEGAEEAFQSVVRNYGQKFGTEAEKEIWSDATIKEYFIEASMGGIAGGGIKAGVEAVGGTVDALGAPISTEATRGERDVVAVRESRDKQALDIAKNIVEEKGETSPESQDAVAQAEKIVTQRETVDNMPTHSKKQAETLDAKIIDLDARKREIIAEAESKIQKNPEKAQEIKESYAEEVGTLVKDLKENKSEFKKVVGEDWQELPSPQANLVDYFDPGTHKKASRVDIKGRQTFNDATAASERTGTSPLQANQTGVDSIAKESVETAEALSTVARTDMDGGKVGVGFKPKVVKINENTRSIMSSINRVFADTQSSIEAIRKLFPHNNISEALFNAIDPNTDSRFATSLRNTISNVETKLAGKRFRTIKGRGAKNLANLILVDGKIPDAIKDKLPLILASAYSDIKQQAKGSYLNEVAEGQAVFNEEYLQHINDSVYANAYVNAVGQAMLRALNVDVTFENNQDINKAMLETSLGMEIVDAMVGEGELTLKKIKMPDGKDRNQIVSGTFNLLNEDIQDVSSIVGLRPTDLPFIKGQEKVSTFKNGKDGKKPTPKLVKAVENMEAMEYNVDIQFLKELEAVFTPEEIKKMMGWTDPKSVHIVQRESVVATNNQLHRAYGQGKDFIALAGKKSFGFTYKMMSSGRAMVEQSIFNPVSDKQFARALIKGKAATVTPENEMNWKRAVVLHLAHKKIERLSDADIENEFLLIERKIKDNSYMKEDFYKSEGIIAYKALVEAKKFVKGEPVESTMFIEVDGLTNGTYFTMMNYVGDSKTFEKYRKALGIFTEKDTINTVQKYFANKGKDVYQMIGENFLEGVKKHFANPKTITTEQDKFAYNGTADYFVGPDGIMDTRELAKPPVMTFGYLAGEQSMARNIAFNMFNELLTQMASTDVKVARKAMKVAVFLYNPNVSKAEMKQFLDNAELTGFKETPVIAEFQTRILDRLVNTYGMGMSASIDKEFGSMKAVASEIAKGMDIAGETYASVINNRTLMRLLDNNYPGAFKKVVSLVENFGPNKPNSSGANQSSSPLKANTQVDTAGGTLKSENIGGVHPTLRTYEAAGASVIPKMNLGLDSDSIASPMEEADFMINVYDAVVTGINEVDTLQKSYNKTLKNDANTYNHIEESIISLEQSIQDAKAFSDVIAQLLKQPILKNETKPMSATDRKALVASKEKIDEMIKSKELAEHIVNLKVMEKNARHVLRNLKKDGFTPNQLAGVSTELDEHTVAPTVADTNVGDIKNTRDDAGQESTVNDLRSLIDNMKLKANNMTDPANFAKVLPLLVKAIGKVAKTDGILKAEQTQTGSSAFKASVLDDGKIDYNLRFNTAGSVDHDTRVLHELFHFATVGAYRNTEFRAKHSKFFNDLAQTIMSQNLDEKSSLTEAELRVIINDNNATRLKRNYAYLRLKLMDGSDSKGFVAESLAILATDKEFRQDVLGRDTGKKSRFKSAMEAVAHFAKTILQPMLRNIINQDKDAGIVMTAQYNEFLIVAEEAMAMKHEMVEGRNTEEQLPDPVVDSSESNPFTKGLSIINKLETRMDKALHKRVEHLLKSSRLSGIVKLKVAEGYSFMATKYPAIDNNVTAVIETTAFKKLLNTFKQLKNVSYDQVHALLGEQAAIDHRATTIMNTLKNDLDKFLKDFSNSEKSLLTDGIMRSDIGTLWAADKDLTKGLINGDVNIDEELATRMEAMLMDYQLDPTEIKAMTDALAKGMIHEEFSVDYTPNSFVMAAMLTGIPTNAIREELMNDIDVYVSILALKESGAIPTIARLDKSALEGILDITGGIQAREQVMFQENAENKIKGYTVTEYNSPQNVTFVPNDEKSKYLADGWRPTGKVLAKGQIMSRNNLDGRYHGGIVPMVSKGKKGYTIEDSMGMTKDEAIALYGENIAPMYQIDNTNNVKIYGYRYLMSKSDKMEFIGMRNDIDELLPAQLSKSIRHVDGNTLAQKILSEATLNPELTVLMNEDGTAGFNPAVVEQEMKVINDKLMLQIQQGKPVDLFIALPKNIDIANYFDKEVLDLFEIINENTPVTEMFKAQGVRYVRKGMNDSLLGYKEDFIFDKRELRYAEHIWKGLISESKKNIVIKNPAVIQGNIMSNLFILKTMGVKMFGNNSANQFRKEYFENFNKYKRLKTLQAIAQEKYDGSTGDRKVLLEKRLAAINRRLERNPLNEAETLGIFQSITDEVLADDVQGSDVFNADARKMFKFFEAEVGDANNVQANWAGDKMYNIAMKSKHVPNSIKKKLQANREYGLTYLDVLRNVYLKEGTAFGNAAIMLTQEADQASRWILFRHIQKELTAQRGMGDIEQINREAGMIATNAFVDYREQLPREMKWLSTYGFWKFITFSMRIQGTLWRMAYDKPMRTMANSATLAFLSEGRSFSPFNSNLVSGSVYGTSLDPSGFDMIQPGYLDIL